MRAPRRADLRLARLLGFGTGLVALGLLCAPLALADGGQADLRGRLEVRDVTDAGEIGLERVTTVSTDAAGDQLVVSGITASGMPAERRVDPAGIGAVGGITFDLSADGRLLVVFDGSGNVVRSHDLSQFGITDARSVTVAPSGDSTDGADVLSVYVADAGDVAAAGASGSAIVELGPATPLVVAGSSGEDAILVRTINTAAWDPFSPDPSGVAWMNGQLLVVDGEVEEEDINTYPYHGSNVFESSPTGTLLDSWDATGFTEEPIGAAFNPATGLLYISEDGGAESIYELGPGSNGEFGDGDDTRSSVPVATFLPGSRDAEGLAVGGGSLWVADGMNGEVIRIVLGTNNRLDATDTSSHFDIAQYGVNTADGIEFDSSAGTLFVASVEEDDGILELSQTGGLLRVISLDNVPAAFSPAGLAMGSNGNLYLSDRGVDNNDDPSENDGRIYELQISEGGPGPSPTPTPTPAPSSTPPPSGHPFTDIAGNQFEADIAAVYEAEITSGCSATLYCPANAVNREQMASFLVRAFDLPPAGTDFFSDDASSIHQADINAVAQAGITSGCAPQSYCPLEVVNREQMASFLARAMQLGPTGTDHFGDDEASPHEDNINRLAAAGVASGCGGGNFCPAGVVSRDQMAAFLRRAVL